MYYFIVLIKYIEIYLVVWRGFNNFALTFGVIATVPAWSSGTLINLMVDSIAQPQTQDMTSHPVTVYRHASSLGRASQLSCTQKPWWAKRADTGRPVMLSIDIEHHTGIHNFSFLNVLRLTEKAFHDLWHTVLNLRAIYWYADVL